ncbi:MAG: hypothetical protein HQL94_05365 [Magnetococcales bacterium]|nr:hypothetical protein [Magnetococcales bacterium]MBF0437833.1 hypothetical protein [Magnetococcales bacterium]
MPAISRQDSQSIRLTNHGIHAMAMLEANEERINALHHTLKLLEHERQELCRNLHGSETLSATEINWLFRPAVPLLDTSCLSSMRQ